MFENKDEVKDKGFIWFNKMRDAAFKQFVKSLNQSNVPDNLTIVVKSSK